MIHQLFGNNEVKENVLIHQFLIHAWISYCKGNTSILALQNVIYTILMRDSIPKGSKVPMAIPKAIPKAMPKAMPMDALKGVEAP